MKTTWITLALISSLALNPTHIMAQDDSNEARTLFGGDNKLSTEKMGFFVAPQYGITQLDGSLTSLFQLRGAITFNDKIAFGAFYNTSLNQVVPQSETLSGIYMDYWTIGGFAEYSLLSKKLVHLSLPLYFGYGEVQMDNEQGDAGLGETNFFKIEPAALLEINMHKYVRLNIGAGYRVISSMNYRNFNQSDISGLTGYIGLKFGLFR
jgi:hypothetical protein